MSRLPSFADIDHFHEFNEQYGHLAGDSMLKMVAGNMKQSSRKTDTIGRWGGEEFLGFSLIKTKRYDGHCQPFAENSQSGLYSL